MRFVIKSKKLSEKLKNNENIQGFKANFMEKDIKNIQHADDKTLTLKNIESLKRA